MTVRDFYLPPHRLEAVRHSITISTIPGYATMQEAGRPKTDSEAHLNATIHFLPLFHLFSPSLLFPPFNSQLKSLNPNRGKQAVVIGPAWGCHACQVSMPNTCLLLGGLHACTCLHTAPSMHTFFPLPPPSLPASHGRWRW